MKDTAILFVAHQVTCDTMGRFDKLRSDLSDTCDVFWGIQVDGEDGKRELPKGIPFYMFSLSGIRKLGYEPLYDDSVLGSVNFILQRFYKDFPCYRRYWSIEFDVVFTGNWHTLVDSFVNEGADFVSCHIERYDKEKNGSWDWWQPLFWVDEQIGLDECVKAFNPIFSLSRRAMDFLDKFLRKGSCGHFETVMSTALYHYGFKLLDMGGMGEFTPPSFRNRFYVQGSGINNGTMRFRPNFLKEEIAALGVQDKLFHPLK